MFQIPRIIGFWDLSIGILKLGYDGSTKNNG